MAPTKPDRLLSDAPIDTLTDPHRIAAAPTNDFWRGRAVDERRVLLTTYPFTNDAERAAAYRDVEVLGAHPSNGLVETQDVELDDPLGHGARLSAFVTQRPVRKLDQAATPRALSAIHALNQLALVSAIELHRCGVLSGALGVDSFGWFEEPDGHCGQKLTIPRRQSTIGRTAFAGPLRNPASNKCRPRNSPPLPSTSSRLRDSRGARAR